MSLIPPTIQDTHVQHAVHSGLLSARAAGFQRRSRIVQPCIDTLREEMGRVNFIVFYERDMTGEAVVGCDGVDLVDEVLAVIVGGMGLPGEQDLYRFPW